MVAGPLVFVACNTALVFLLNVSWLNVTSDCVLKTLIVDVYGTVLNPSKS
jgi:hypothetical protein